MKLTKRNLKELIQEEIGNLTTEQGTEDSSRQAVGKLINDLDEVFRDLSDIIISGGAFGYPQPALMKAQGLLLDALDVLDPPEAPEDRM
jgi:3-dehydroquinate dehydratase